MPSKMRRTFRTRHRRLPKKARCRKFSILSILFLRKNPDRFLSASAPAPIISQAFTRFSRKMSTKPIIAVTMGDPAVQRAAQPLVLGDWGVLRRAARRLKRNPRLILWRPNQPLLRLFEQR